MNRPDLPALLTAGGSVAVHPPRPRVHGKFLWAGDEKLWLKGVTYGTFAPDAAGIPFPAQDVVRADFAAMAAAGFNSVRTYTVPPRLVLDAAAEVGLRVVAGLPWEQHVAFLDDAARAADIVRRVRDAVRACAAHPALLCYTVGNEIPAPIVRWHGRRAIERFIERLYRAVKDEDAGALVGYVNYPTTEYLELPFLDLLCFNVYLEHRERLEDYLARLQNLAGERPLVMMEIGLDSRRNGLQAQADSLAWQVRTAFAEGCAGAFVFAWTDEWHRGGHAIDDWDFGLVDRERRPKPALAAVTDAFAVVPFADDAVDWPRISVVVCSYNGSRTIRDTLEGLARIDYPDFEVIVVNDGSKDATPQIAAEYPVRLISTENRGLSNARNTGWQAATGEIVAYIDDDAYPDPHWLRYLGHAFRRTDFVGIGGPNLAPPGDGEIADCVANSPGGPVQVLISDRVAEHIPGCNMAFRRAALEAIDGFDPRYRTAGDDVDLCWRLQDAGGTIGFHASALVWHHRRNSARMFWRQQLGYGKAESLLEEKWPQRYNAIGHLTWTGRLYGKGLTLPGLPRRWWVYHGPAGGAPFQSLYQPGPGTWLSLPLMPEWYLVVAALALLALLGLSWAPLAAPALIGLLIAIALPVSQAVRSARAAHFTSAPGPGRAPLRLHVITAVMHLGQPLARLIGRIRHRLTPWRVRGPRTGIGLPRSRTRTVWSEHWRAQETWLELLRGHVASSGAIVTAGGAFDRWDLDVRGGLLGGARVLLATEEHGAGRQLVRIRIRARAPWPVAALVAATGALALGAAAGGGTIAAVVLGTACVATALRAAADCSAAQGAALGAADALCFPSTAA